MHVDMLNDLFFIFIHPVRVSACLFFCQTAIFFSQAFTGWCFESRPEKAAPQATESLTSKGASERSDQQLDVFSIILWPGSRSYLCIFYFFCKLVYDAVQELKGILHHILKNSHI